MNKKNDMAHATPISYLIVPTSIKCVINVSYTNLEDAIKVISNDIQNKFDKNAYVVSPLNRIAPKFGHTTSSLIKELYYEDISISLLNEFYNNNIPVKLNDDNS